MQGAGFERIMVIECLRMLDQDLGEVNPQSSWSGLGLE